MEAVLPVPRETELKFELDANGADRLRATPLIQSVPAGKQQLLVSTYFDTPDRDLQKQGVSLRIRRQGRRLIQTIKAEVGNGSLLDRAEWESRVTSSEPDRSQFEGTALASLADAELVPLFVSRVERSVHAIRRAGAHIEFAIDSGRIEACAPTQGASAAPVSFVEVELELKRGAPAALFDVARELNRSVPLRLGLMTKCGRGYMLLDAQPAQISKAEGVDLDPDMSVRDAFQALARECVRHLVANAPALLERREVEAVHQMRVAIRRLRAAMSLFRAVLRDGQSEHIKNELRWIGRQFGEARNLDVFIADVIEPMLESHPGEPGMAELLDYFQPQRATAYDKVLSITRGERFAAALIDTLAWIEVGDWANETDEAHRLKLLRPVRKLAAAELSRRWRKISRKGEHLKSLPADERHKLRIDIKKVRYAAEFFATLYSGRKAGKRRKRLQQLLAGLQDSLGELNDMAVNHQAEVQLTRVEGRGGAAVARRRAYAAGMLAGHQFTKAEPLLRTAVKDYGRFRKAEPFWDK
ncbi:CYTH and CHAD domain-containing protein [Chelatococcus reniformis]|uniref:Inorganic triphosphatase n=1 Tax=Chelatococcus reniformis TaxID=1494448 RepID=A0A916X9G9_9HYPH|nr:CYTH and CHAD domain-containing protein [Chelatococcus reniformis]GGC56994.1 inorganic triphosphatase [Chelatococcus reniformis]